MLKICTDLHLNGGVVAIGYAKGHIKLRSGTKDKIYGDLIISRLGLKIVAKGFYNPKRCMQIVVRVGLKITCITINFSMEAHFTVANLILYIIQILYFL